jgi:AcrR family transcriptional regulator
MAAQSVSKRDEQKLQTRAKVLAAAKALFADPGYAQTTTRMIAERAGVALGSIFTTFASKEELLTAVIGEGYDLLEDAFARGLAIEGDLTFRIESAFREAFAQDYGRLDLLMHQIGASFTWSHAFETQARAGIAKAFTGIVDALIEAKRQGHLARDINIDALTHILLGLYLRAFRHAYYRRLSLDEINAFVAAQVRIVMHGALTRGD